MLRVDGAGFVHKWLSEVLIETMGYIWELTGDPRHGAATSVN